MLKNLELTLKLLNFKNFVIFYLALGRKLVKYQKKTRHFKGKMPAL